MIDTITPTKRVGKHNFEVRCDGFGTMSDAEVHEYKMHPARRMRYIMYYLAHKEPGFKQPDEEVSHGPD